MKLIIAGSRDFNNYELLETRVLSFIKKYRQDDEPVEIISGGARGADKLGEKFADRFGLTKHLMPAEWNKYGKAAGFRRNKEMANIATHCILFWDGQSKGTKNMYSLAVGKNLVLEQVNFMEETA
jgi:hypothetical protein